MGTTRWLNEDEQRTWRAYMAANRLLFDQLDRELQDVGIPHSYYEILVRLSESPDRALRMSELAVNSQSSRSRVSHAVSRLESFGWVRRQSCPSDGRGALAVLTPQGLNVLEAAAEVHVESVRTHLFDQLSPEQVLQLRQVSEAVVSHLAALGEPGAASSWGCDQQPSPATRAGLLAGRQWAAATEPAPVPTGRRPPHGDQLE